MMWSNRLERYRQKPICTTRIKVGYGTRKQLLCYSINDVFFIFLGFCVGYCVVFYFSMGHYVTLHSRCPPVRTSIQTYNFQPPVGKKFMLVAMMTTREFLKTRVADIHDTWGRRIPGDILYFVGGSEEYTGNLPVVVLPHLNDTMYPPQTKSFTMIQYITEHFSEHYEWFIRADDDLYIKMDKLEHLLQQVDSRKTWYIGQPGFGLANERGKLGLQKAFCMGGPGIIFSSSTLLKLSNHLIKDCLPDIVTSHEDTELGRCVSKYLGVQCTWAYEMRALFVNSQNNKFIKHEIKMGPVEDHAITLHPIKVHPHMHRIDALFSHLKVKKLQNKVFELTQEIFRLDHKIKHKSTAAVTNISNHTRIPNVTIKPEQKTTANKATLQNTRASLTAIKSGTRNELASTLQTGSNLWSNEVPPTNISKISKNSILLKFIDKEEDTDLEWDFIGKNRRMYSRHNQYEATDIFMSMSSRYKSKVVSEIAMKYGLKKNFKLLPMVYLRLKAGKQMETIFIGKSPDRRFQVAKTIQRCFGVQFWEVKEVSYPEMWIIVSLFERPQSYERFLSSLVKAVDNFGQKIHLSVVLHHDKSKQHLESQSITKRFYNASRNLQIRIIYTTETFSRGHSLSKGMDGISNSSLLIFLDVDIVFDEHFLHRVHKNTIYGKQVYFPICFSQYHPALVCYKHSDCSPRTDDFGSSSGLWRYFGFGIAAMYKNDYHNVNGFNLDIKGWGKEDMDLYEKFIRKPRIEVFRAADPSLVHLHHDKTCNRDKLQSKYWECLSSKVGVFGSNEILSKIAMDFKLVL